MLELFLVSVNMGVYFSSQQCGSGLEGLLLGMLYVYSWSLVRTPPKIALLADTCEQPIFSRGSAVPSPLSSLPGLYPITQAFSSPPRALCVSSVQPEFAHTLLGVPLATALPRILSVRSLPHWPFLPTPHQRLMYPQPRMALEKTLASLPSVAPDLAAVSCQGTCAQATTTRASLFLVEPSVSLAQGPTALVSPFPAPIP